MKKDREWMSKKYPKPKKILKSPLSIMPAVKNKRISMCSAI